MSQLSAVPEHHPFESPFEQHSSGLSSLDDGSPKRSTHSTAKRSSSTGKPVQRQLSIDSQMSASIRKMAPAELPSSRVKQSHVWGWLEPSSNSELMPVTYLKGAGAAIGRGAEAFEAQQGQHAESTSSFEAAMQTTRGADHLPKMSFVEVGDTRVSRLHCTIRLQAPRGSASTPLQAVLQDHSSNGTYIDDERVKPGVAVPLHSGSRVSLVRSVTPWVERGFTFWEGDPRDCRSGAGSDTGEAAFFASEAAQAAASGSPRRKLERSATSDYTTAESSTLDDFQCQICLGPVKQCVSLEPCGHNWCATCLSHHFASLLQSGVPLACPLRCVAPERIVANKAVRRLVDTLSPPPPEQPARSNSTSLARSVSRHSSIPEQPDTELEVMSAICPLADEYLPLDASNLKIKQLEVCMRQLEDTSSDALVVLTALEAVARLAWSDDEVREEVAQMEGIEAVARIMEAWQKHEGVQCNGCLALMALVRGDGSVCQANQFRVAEARGVEAVVAAMTRFPHQATVQLSALLCFIPLALENIMMQAHVCQVGLSSVLAALNNHPVDTDIQAKGLVVLGVLGQGDDVVHDAIRQQQVEAGVPALIAAALRRYQGQHEEVLWAALFSLAVLIREGSNPYIVSTEAAVHAGLLPLLQSAVKDYEARAEQGGEADMISTAGNYLIELLTAISYVLKAEEIVSWGMLTIAVAAAGVLAAYLWRRK
ncbi:hypothetical protein ABBQ32_006605 [Trebouxia sp. C0010 RCD-2024]